MNVDELITFAEAQSITITWHKNNPKGMWYPHTRTISLRLGMSDTQTRCTLAHELGHAHHLHPAGHNLRHELIADRYAARLLINPLEYAEIETVYGSYPARIAHELGVTTHLLTVWRNHLPYSVDLALAHGHEFIWESG